MSARMEKNNNTKALVSVYAVEIGGNTKSCQL